LSSQMTAYMRLIKPMVQLGVSKKKEGSQ